ncbi:MAG: hypothetical protein NG740_02695 [Omnitrophica bacterium]|nr:hypothetical protein [Candidatus Omnitrophota bacterium]
MFKKSLSVFLCALIFFSQAAYGAGLRTALGIINVDNIGIGRTYSLANDNNTPFVLKNTSDVALGIRIEVIKPEERDLLEGYEPIPDTDWITIEESEFTIPANDKVSTDVVIEIPYDEEHSGKAYQAYIWSHTTTGSVIFGLKSKLLITIAE